MGHRANFVIIENDEANAYFDQWAGLGAVQSLTDGPDAAADIAREFDPTDELLDWAFAEGGYLLDFDEQVLICFGGLGDGEDDYSDYESDEEEDDFDEDEEDEYEDGELVDYSAKYREFFEEIAPEWEGWSLRWDERGVDAFAEYLAQRGIHSIQCQEESHPEEVEGLEFQA